MLEDNEELDTKADRFDIQSVLFCHARGDGVSLAGKLKVLHTMTLPFTQKNDELLSCSTAWDGEAQDFGCWFDVEEPSEPRASGIDRRRAIIA